VKKSSKGEKDMEKARLLIKNEKTVKLIIYGGFALIMLFLLSTMFPSSETEEIEGKVDTVSEHEAQLEEKLKKAISAIDGVGELTIVVTLDSLSETVYSERGGGVKTVITPKVRGVAVICEGGGDIIVKQKIVELTSRVLGIGTTRISVTN
jgi:stage III sporulation protein AG